MAQSCRDSFSTLQGQNSQHNNSFKHPLIICWYVHTQTLSLRSDIFVHTDLFWACIFVYCKSFLQVEFGIWLSECGRVHAYVFIHFIGYSWTQTSLSSLQSENLVKLKSQLFTEGEKTKTASLFSSHWGLLCVFQDGTQTGPVLPDAGSGDPWVPLAVNPSFFHPEHQLFSLITCSLLSCTFDRGCCCSFFKRNHVMHHIESHPNQTAACSDLMLQSWKKEKLNIL